MHSRFRDLLLAALAAATLVSGCGGDEDGDGSAGEGTQPPGRLAGGDARFEVSGDLDASVSLELRPDSIYSAPPGGMSLSYDDEEGNFFGIGGTTFTGARATSLQLSVTITVAGTEPMLFVSEGGECTVDVDRADANGVAGSFQCSDLANSEASIDAVGTFSAAA